MKFLRTASYIFTFSFQGDELLALRHVPGSCCFLVLHKFDENLKFCQFLLCFSLARLLNVLDAFYCTFAMRCLYLVPMKDAEALQFKARLTRSN